MVPVEFFAFGILVLCAILLAAAQILQWLPGLASVVATSMAVALGDRVFITTAQ